MADDKPKSQSAKDEQVTDSLSNLSINTSEAKPKKTDSKPTKKSKKVVADSWDDESLSSDADADEAEETTQAPLSTATTTTTASTSSLPSAPPPTPISPITSHTQGGSSGSSSAYGSATLPSAPERRPEKTDAVARRMIAAGLGLKAPKRTEEQREYEKSIREQEKRRREQEKLAEQRRKEEAERAKAAIWDD